MLVAGLLFVFGRWIRFRLPFNRLVMNARQSQMSHLK